MGAESECALIKKYLQDKDVIESEEIGEVTINYIYKEPYKIILFPNCSVIIDQKHPSPPVYVTVIIRQEQFLTFRFKALLKRHTYYNVIYFCYRYIRSYFHVGP